MWAEIYIRTKNDLPTNLTASLSERIKATADVRGAIDATTWAGQYDYESEIVLAQRSNSLVLLVFSDGKRELRIHVESTIDKSDLRQLRKCAEEVAIRALDFVRHSINSAEEIKISIYAENNYLQTGERSTWWQRFIKSVKEDLLVKLYVPAATFLASMTLGYEIKRAGFNVLAAVFAMLVWALISASIVTSTFTYSEK
jgi:hypothetical protein